MNDRTRDVGEDLLEARSRKLFVESVDAIDMRMRSRLTQARHAALDCAAAASHRPWLLRIGTWASAAGVTAAAVLATALWFGSPLGNHGLPTADTQATLEDLDILTASDEGSADPIEMLQNDLDFYDFSDKAANFEPAA